MASNEQIIKEADYYLSNNVSVDQASKALGISRRTFQLHMKKLEEIHPTKAVLVRTKKLANIKSGNILGGQTGKRSVSYTLTDVSGAALEMIEHGESYREASVSLGIPKSTLHEMINSKGLSKDKIELLYIQAKKENPTLALSDFLDIFYTDKKLDESHTNKK